MRPFNFDFHQGQQQVIHIFSGWIVDGMKVVGQGHSGGQGGNHRQIILAPGESIVKITGTRTRFEQQVVIG